MASEPRRAVLGLALVLAVGAMSTAAILIRLVSTAGPLAIAFHRMLFASLLLAPWALVRHRAELRALAWRETLALGGIGVVLGLHFATWITSLRLTTVASSVVLVTLHPALVAVASLLLLHEGLTRRGWFGIALALLGGALLVGGDRGLGQGALTGDGLAFLGAVFAAIYFLGGRVQRQRHSLPVYALVVYVASAATLLVLALAVGEPLRGFASQDYLLMLALAAGPQVLGHTIANWSLRWLPASVVSTAIVGEPVGSAFLALVVLGEVPPALALLGGGLILVGIYLVARGQKPRMARDEAATPP